MTTILLLASIQAFFLASLLFSKRQKQLADKMLGVWLSLIGLHTLIYFVYAKFPIHNPTIMNLNAGFPFLQGPFLYFYVETLTADRARVKRSFGLHLLPCLIFAMYQMLIQNPFGVLPHGQHVSIHLFDLPGIFGGILLASVPAYIVWSWFLLRKYQVRILEAFSAIEEINLNWLRYLLTALGLLWLTVITVFIFMKFSGDPRVFGIPHLIFLGITLFVYATGYFGFKQTNIFSNATVIEKQTGKENTPKETSSPIINQTSEPESQTKYQRSGLKQNEAQEILTQLHDYMNTEKPYLNDRLTLSQLATELDISGNHLSQIINEQSQQSFFDFVNHYRIEAVKEKLQDTQYDAHSLLAIALDCGFGSKSSFNRIFKNTTGRTPTQYRNRLEKT
ncbi:MAG: helix-turn-helix transcriptional regulator [Candidatus Latescibacteria bacterium]|jgi:AraC-like DNA-binding protein|nr:helix-turn-helix transcriptional regulator [Candidatus Latescibacterota bacterium]MBT4137455.1 helix-turn-helix transcriptional regulator [Candidatus Latescibacterota bacterium]MBT5828807.1 helix-turn-helix transcriptional regulator [Candidatus Latescibacterota bacterium]